VVVNLEDSEQKRRQRERRRKGRDPGRPSLVIHATASSRPVTSPRACGVWPRRCPASGSGEGVGGGRGMDVHPHVPHRVRALVYVLYGTHRWCIAPHDEVLRPRDSSRVCMYSCIRISIRIRINTCTRRASIERACMVKQSRVVEATASSAGSVRGTRDA